MRLSYQAKSLHAHQNSKVLILRQRNCIRARRLKNGSTFWCALLLLMHDEGKAEAGPSGTERSTSYIASKRGIVAAYGQREPTTGLATGLCPVVA